MTTENKTHKTVKEDNQVTQAELKDVIDNIGQLLKKNYVFPDIAEKIETLLSGKLESGKYKSLNNVDLCFQKLTEDIQSVNNDKHLQLMFNPKRIAELRANKYEDNKKAVASQLLEDKRCNYGFSDVRILEGNIGYLNLTCFAEPETAGETAVAAMNYLSNSDALIIDLRLNGGGSPEMVQLITSYLFNPEPVHLNSFYYRPENKYQHTYTLPFVPGKRIPEKDVYLLISNNTFSAAEEFSYNLRNLERATLIGETTGGGAHPGDVYITTDRFMIFIPTGKAINPVSKTNWEGTGVKPHIEIPQSEALFLAHKTALEKLASNQSDASDIFHNWHLEGLTAKAENVQVDKETLEKYTGKYGNIEISVDNEDLYYRFKNKSKRKLEALDQDLFILPGIDSFRIRISAEKNKSQELILLNEDGTSNKMQKGAL